MKVYGHRGASAHERENTIAAFRRAFDDGADGVELDVRACGSGEIVVLHDPRLERVFGDPRAVRTMRLPEIRRVAPQLPTLDEVWDDCSARGTIHVEVKSDGASWREVAEAVRRWARRRGLHRAPNGLRLSSFDPRVLAWLAIGAPRVKRALIYDEKGRGPFSPIATARVTRCAGIHPRHRLVDERLVVRARALGMEINSWTVDDEGEVRRLAALGTDGVISNDPARTRKALGA